MTDRYNFGATFDRDRERKTPASKPEQTHADKIRAFFERAWNQVSRPPLPAPARESKMRLTKNELIVIQLIMDLQIIELFGDVPRIELFSRSRIEGWDCWGDQVPLDEQKLLWVRA